MADTVSIIYTFTTTDGDKNFTYKYADPDSTPSNIKTVAQTIITNGSIFVNPPLELKSAKLRTVSEDNYDINN